MIWLQESKLLFKKEIFNAAAKNSVCPRKNTTEGGGWGEFRRVLAKNRGQARRPARSEQDAIFSLTVIVGAAMIYVTGWNWVDPILSIIDFCFSP
jgi:hypothetical protein